MAEAVGNNRFLLLYFDPFRLASLATSPLGKGRQSECEQNGYKVGAIGEHKQNDCEINGYCAQKRRAFFGWFSNLTKEGLCGII